jgi:hypothetical protein
MGLKLTKEQTLNLRGATTAKAFATQLKGMGMDLNDTERDELGSIFEGLRGEGGGTEDEKNARRAKALGRAREIGIKAENRRLEETKDARLSDQRRKDPMQDAILTALNGINEGMKVMVSDKKDNKSPPTTTITADAPIPVRLTK